MKRTIGMVLLLTCAACGPQQHGSPTGDANATTRFVGRVDTNVAGGALMAWPGTSVETRFNGSSITVSMQNSQPSDVTQMQVVLDGQAQATPLVLQPNVSSYTIPAQGDGPHTLLLVKRTEAADGKVLISGFQASGSLLSAPAEPNRLVEFIGDSITAGYGDLASSPNCPSSAFADPNFEDALQAYGPQTAVALNADWSVVAVSGRGVVTNNDGTPGNGSNPSEVAMPAMWTLTNPDDPNSTYDFKRPADVVVIDLGTNDFSYYGNNTPPSNPPQTAFVNGYTALVQQVRGQYPKAQIILALGPMLSDSYPTGLMQLTTARGYVQAVVTAVNDPKVSSLEFPVNTSQYGCNYHPNAAYQSTMAQQLTTKIKTLTGW